MQIGIDKAAIIKLFAILQARYGHKWTSVYDDPDIMRIAVNEWYRCLKGFRPIDIATGIDAWMEAWPPSLPEFIIVCMPDLDELGYDVEAAVSANMPRYIYEPNSPTEESRRFEERARLREQIEKDMRTEAILQIELHGIDSLIEDKTARKMIQ